MTLKVFITLMIGVVFLIFVYIIMKGKGDKFIAGYNTASEEEKAQVNIKRLRLLVALTCVLSSGFCVSLPFLAQYNGAVVGATVVLMCFALGVVVLANTWARKK